MNITISDSKNIDQQSVVNLYKANKWSSAEKPELLYQALIHSHSLTSAWENDRLIGIGNAISDGHLVVYCPHLLVHPDYHGKGVGKMIMDHSLKTYKHLHMQVLTADREAIGFYEKMGFEKAGETQPMWIYKGDEH